MKLWHFYVLLAVVGFVATGSQVLGYLDAGPFGGTADFWEDAFGSNDAARFLAFDVAILGLAVFVHLWGETRKVGIRARTYWLYVAGSLLIGISTFVPLLLAHRERALARLNAA